MAQRTYNPVDYGFKWTDNWYEWDYKKARQDARKDRDNDAKAAEARGMTVSKFRIPNQLITRGGIGTDHPEISEFVTVFGFNTY